MNPADNDWNQVKALFEACLDATAEQRARLLADDTTLPPSVRAEVQALLAAYAGAPMLEQGAAAWAAPLFADGFGDEDPAPAQIGPYRVLRELGRGGMGMVWLAERDEPGLHQRVALKRIRTGLDSPDLRLRFRRERAILARLTHNRIARLLDGGVDADSRPWFALEYVEGQTILQWCDARRFRVRDRASLFLDVLDAVAYAHRNLVVHRDLKPANVLVDEAGHVKLLDFGIAKLLADEDDSSHTATGAQPMTPTYAAPEQVRGEPVSTATDTYALGVLLYELTIGVSPYRVDPSSRAALSQAIVDTEPERVARAFGRAGVDVAALAQARATTPASLRRELDRDLEQILFTALAKLPDQRYASVDVFAADLRAWLERRPLLSRPTPRLRRLAQFVRRHRVGVAASAAIGLTALAGVAATLWQAREVMRHAATERAVREFTASLFAAVDPDQARGREVPLREVLDQGARRAESGLKDQPAVRAALLSDLGAIYTSLGDNARAMALLGQAREILTDLPERNVDELANTWLRLAEVQFEDAQYVPAAQSADAALILLAARTATDPLRLEAELRRVRIDEETDHLDAANTRAEAMVAALRADASATPAALSDALSTLGNLRRLQTRFEDALAIHSEALELARRADPDDPIIASRLHELAGAEQQIDQPKLAIAHLREAYDLHLKVHGANHPLTLSTEGELAWVLSQHADYAEAETLFERNIDKRRAVFGAKHSKLAISLNNYGVMRYTQRRYAQAAPLFEQAWQIWQVSLGAEHVSTRRALTGYGAALVEIDALARAEPLLREAYDMSQRLDPPRGQGSARNTYAILLERSGKLEDAERLLRAGLALEVEANQGAAVLYTWPLTLLGRVLRERGDLAGARQYLEEAAAGFDADDFPDGPRTATCLVQLALVRQAQHESTDTVRPLLERALATQEAKLGTDHVDSIATRKLLAGLER